MTILVSSARRIDALVQDLHSPHIATREGAVARLMVIGTRAVERLTALAADEAAPPAARTAALRALEGIGDERALDVALRVARGREVEVATAGVALARTFLTGDRDLRALDGLTAVALDRSRPDVLRESAVRALRDLDDALVSPVMDALLTDTSSRLREIARRESAQQSPAAGPVDTWLDRLDRDALPDDLETVRHGLARRGAEVPLTVLLQVAERIRERERGLPPAEARHWKTARAAVHVALATRGSRLGVYDLREALEAASEPLPVEFLAALTLVGDGSCLEPIAGAFDRAGGAIPPDASADDWWLQHLGDAFQSIVARERITRRHAVARKIEKRWPAASRALWPGGRAR